MAVAPALPEKSRDLRIGVIAHHADAEIIGIADRETARQYLLQQFDPIHMAKLMQKHKLGLDTIIETLTYICDPMSKAGSATRLDATRFLYDILTEFASAWPEVRQSVARFKKGLDAPVMLESDEVDSTFEAKLPKIAV